jgi:hypothetical protein
VSKTSTLIKLAPNPEDGDDGFGGDPTGSMGDQGTGDNEYYDDMAEGDAADDMDDLAYKGKRVHGPRTKLASSDDRMGRIEQSLGALAKSVNALAKVQKAMLTKDFDDEGFDDEAEDEDEGEQDPMDVQDMDEDALNLARTSKSKASKSKGPKTSKAGSKVAKDDAASSFGEKDDTAPGNRPYDQTNPGEDDTIVQGGPGAGPGPISKGQGTFVTAARLEAMINRGVRQALDAAGVSRINKSVAPGVGSSSKLDKSERAVDMAELSKGLRNRSFSEINRLRVELGDLPAGVI